MNKPKTQHQKGAMYIWLEQLANTLNKNGLYFEFNTLIGKSSKKVPWTKGLCKEFIWKPVLKALTDKASTEHMTTIEPQEVYMAICGHIQAEHGFNLPLWPSHHRDYSSNEVKS